MVQYSATQSNGRFFRNAYSYVNVAVTPMAGTSLATYVEIPPSLATDKHVQRFFGVSTNSTATISRFDLFFPLPTGTNTIDIKIYPQGTDVLNITTQTPFFPFRITVTNLSDGSALLLGLEDKEKNVRVFRSPDTQPPTNQSAQYTWTGAALPDTNPKIAGAIAHVTELYDSKFILNNNFFLGTAPVNKNLDPYTGKYHLYLATGANGIVTLTATPGATACWGHLIYWPFADNASEVARIVVYNPFALGTDLFGPIPTKNPTTIQNNTTIDGPSFTILNDASPKAISNDGSLFILINDTYDSTVPASCNKKIKFNATTRFISGATSGNPQSNNARYIYAKEDGSVSTSPRYSFFIYLDQSDDSDC